MSNATYNALGKPFDVTLGNGLTTSYRYWGIDYGSTNYGMPRSIATGGRQGLTYGYDAKGNVSSLADTRNSETTTFGYDHLDRLTSASSALFSEAYAYNSIGNLTSKGSETHIYPAAGQIRPHAPDWVLNSNNTYGYDNNGNLTSAEERTYVYDIQNRLTQILQGVNEVSSFTYDGDGALRTMVKSGDTIRYVTPDYRVNVNSGEVTVYYRFGGKAVAYRNGSGLRYVVSDHLSSTHGEVGENQAEMGQRRNYPFGSDRAVSGASDIADEERYTSQRRIDAGNGNARREIYHYGARAYLPGIGIFTQPDTIVPDYKNPQALNRFAYCVNNPLKYIDSTGHNTGDPYLMALQGNYSGLGGANPYANSGSGSEGYFAAAAGNYSVLDGPPAPRPAPAPAIVPATTQGDTPTIRATTPFAGSMTVSMGEADCSRYTMQPAHSVTKQYNSVSVNVDVSVGPLAYSLSLVDLAPMDVPATCAVHELWLVGGPGLADEGASASVMSGHQQSPGGVNFEANVPLYPKPGVFGVGPSASLTLDPQTWNATGRERGLMVGTIGVAGSATKPLLGPLRW